jgi:hypothetical protein
MTEAGNYCDTGEDRFRYKWNTFGAVIRFGITL